MAISYLSCYATYAYNSNNSGFIPKDPPIIIFYLIHTIIKIKYQ